MDGGKSERHALHGSSPLPWLLAALPPSPGPGAGKILLPDRSDDLQSDGFRVNFLSRPLLPLDATFPTVGELRLSQPHAIIPAASPWAQGHG